MSKRTVRHRDDGPSRAYYRHLDVGSEPGDEIELDAEAAAYLVEQGHHEYVDSEDVTESGYAEDDDSGGESEPDPESESEPETDSDSEDRGYETHPREELEAMEYNTLQKMASEADLGDVDGRSSRADIIDAFAADAE